MSFSKSTPKTDLTPPAALLPWLSCSDSLTEMLEKNAGDHRLEVLMQDWVSPDCWVKKELGYEKELILQREIVMYAWDNPCWYARTMIPKATLEANAAFFSRLTRESLGELVFHTQEISRTSLVYYPIGKQSLEYHWLNDLHCHQEVLWVRLSVFSLSERYPFYLIEILLPHLERYSH